jgi:hypothetical protein
LVPEGAYLSANTVNKVARFDQLLQEMVRQKHTAATVLCVDDNGSIIPSGGVLGSDVFAVAWAILDGETWRSRWMYRFSEGANSEELMALIMGLRTILIELERLMVQQQETDGAGPR